MKNSSSGNKLKETSKKVFIITGITGAVGKGIFLGLLDSYPKLKIYGTGRSLNSISSSFTKTIDELPKLFQKKLDNFELELIPLPMDTSKLDTIKEACNLIYKENDNLDGIFLNAGSIISNGINYSNFIQQFIFDPAGFPVRPGYILHDGQSLIEEGLTLSFGTNVYGHYVMVHLLNDLLNKSNQARIIWTGSSEGEQKFFDIEDIQGINSINTYGSNKYCLHLISTLLNLQYQKESSNTISLLAQPGVIPSNLAKSLVSPFLVDLFMSPCLYLLRFAFDITELTMTSETAASSMIHCLTLPSNQISTSVRYDSIADRFGNPGVQLIELPEPTSSELSKVKLHLEKLNEKFQI